MLQVSGLFDHDRRRRDRRRHRTRRRPTARRRSSCRSTREAPSSATTRWQSCCERIADAPIPIGIWVGPSGAPPLRHAGAAPRRRRRHRHGAWRAGRLHRHPARRSPMADGRLRRSPPTRFATDRSGCPTRAASACSSSESPTRGSPTIANMVDALDGYEEDGVVLDTTTEVVTRRRNGSHATPSPSLASRSSASSTSCSTPSPARPSPTSCCSIGLALLIFEFFTAGVGIAGVVGAGLHRARLLRASPRSRPAAGRSG